VRKKEDKICTAGYLELGEGFSSAYIGSTDSSAYKLVQSLFSPSNTRNTRFNPVTQSLERTYINMMRTRLADPVTVGATDDVERTVRRAIKAVAKTEAGQHLSFIQTKAGITMSILPPVAAH
jgi:hypothetical protein